MHSDWLARKNFHSAPLPTLYLFSAPLHLEFPETYGPLVTMAVILKRVFHMPATAVTQLDQKFASVDHELSKPF